MAQLCCFPIVLALVQAHPSPLMVLSQAFPPRVGLTWNTCFFLRGGGLFPDPGPRWLPPCSAGVCSPVRLTGTGQGPFSLLPGSCLVMLPCPNESGSSGHPGSAFKEGRQPFPQPIHSHGFWNHFGFLTRKRRECYCILTLKKSSSDLYSHHGVQATWKSFSGPLSSSTLLRNWGMGWGAFVPSPTPPRLRERLLVGNSPEMGSSEVLF